MNRDNDGTHIADSFHLQAEMDGGREPTRKMYGNSTGGSGFTQEMDAALDAAGYTPWQSFWAGPGMTRYTVRERPY